MSRRGLTARSWCVVVDHRRGGDGEPRPVNEALNRIMRSLGAPPGDAFSRIRDRWPEWVGPDLVDHCEVLSLRDGALVVRVDQPPFVTSLRWSEARIVAACDEEIGAGLIERLTIRVGPAASA